MVPKYSDIIKKYGLVGIGIALDEEVCHCGGRSLGLLYVKTLSNVSSLPVAHKI